MLSAQIERLMKERAQEKDRGPITWRMKEVAKELAVIDRRGSYDVVLCVLEISSEWDDARRVETAEFGDGRRRFPAAMAFSIADGAAEKMRKYGSQNDNDWVLKNARLCYCVCPARRA
jgi:hypothetical protein